jgi:hypothetical protein
VLNRRSPKPLARRDDDRRITREVVVSVVTYHLAQTLRKQIVSWVVVSGLLVGGLVFHLVWWSFIAVGAYLWWYSSAATRHRAAPSLPTVPQRGALEGAPEDPFPPIQWIDVMPDDHDFREALAKIMPDHGAALFQRFAPHGHNAAVSATRHIQRALHQQQKLALDTSALIAYASDFKFPVAMIALPDANVRLDRLPAAPTRAIVQSEDGPWLLAALGDERAFVRAAAPAHAAARPAPPPSAIQPGRPASTRTTELEMRLPAAEPTPIRPAAPAPPAPAYGTAEDDFFAALMAGAPPKSTIDAEEQRAILDKARQIMATPAAVRASGPLDASAQLAHAATMEWGTGNAAAPAVAASARADQRPLYAHAAVPARPSNPDITLGYNRETGEPVTAPIAALSGILVVTFGIPRTGKTSSLEGLVQRTSQAGMPWGIAYDTKPEWHGLRSAANPAEAVPLVILGDGANADVQMPIHGLSPTLLDLPEKPDEKRERMELLATTLTSWQRTIEWLMEHRQSWICDLSSERIGIEGSSRVLTAVLLAAVRSARRHRQPFGILIDEAQNALPQGRIRKQLWEAAMGITRTAPSLGVTTFLAAHRPTDVDKDLIAPARLRILHRVDLPLDIDAYAKMLPWPYDQVGRTVESLQPGEAIVYEQGLLSSGNPPVVVRMMPATTFHAGYTPTIGVPPPVAPPHIAIDAAILETIARIPGAMVQRQSRPDTAPASTRIIAAVKPTASTGLLAHAPDDVTAASAPPTTGRLELLTPDRWPEEVQASVAVMLRNPAVRNLVLHADQIGVTFPLYEEATGTPLARKARLAILARPDLLALLAAARAGGTEQKPLARLMFGIADPGRAGNEIGAAINAWEAAQHGEPTTVAATDFEAEGLADDSE